MRLVLLALITVVSLPTRGTATQTGSAASVDSIIRKLETDWERALVFPDQATINRIVAEDCVFISSTGEQMTKAEVDTDRSHTKISLSTVTQMKVRVFGDIAIVVGANVETSTYDGQDTSGRYRWTDVFALRNGRWQVVSAQSTRIDSTGL
jgi:ketosteroid isomerase-like protein